jgi:hypothetical protein
MKMSNQSDQHITNEEMDHIIQSGEKPAHLEQCQQCQTEYHLSKNLFAQIVHDTQLSPSSNLWQKIEHKHQLKQYQLDQKQQSKLRAQHSKYKNWSFVAIAASMLVVIGLQWNGLNVDRNIQNQIQANILKSQQLEKMYLSSSKTVGYSNNYLFNQQLQQIDEQLQNAYQQNRSAETILGLWNKRIGILKNKNKKKNSPNNIETI